MARLAMRGWGVGSRAAAVEVEGRQASREACTERKTTSRAALRHAHERSWGEGDAREETSCQSREERRRRGKVQCHGNQRGSTSISRKRQLQGSRVGQGVGSLGPPALLGRAGLDLSQPRTDLGKLHRNWKTRGRLSGRRTD